MSQEIETHGSALLEDNPDHVIQNIGFFKYAIAEPFIVETSGWYQMIRLVNQTNFLISPFT